MKLLQILFLQLDFFRFLFAFIKSRMANDEQWHQQQPRPENDMTMHNFFASSFRFVFPLIYNFLNFPPNVYVWVASHVIVCMYVYMYEQYPLPLAHVRIVVFSLGVEIVESF